LSPLRRITRFGLELTYTSSQFLGLGAGFRWYPIPDYLMIRLDEYSYFSAARVPQDTRVALGGYLFTPPHWRVRFGVAAGLGVILSCSRAPLMGLVLGGGRPVAGSDWDRGRCSSGGGQVRPGDGSGLLERGFLTGYGPQYTLGWLWKW